MSQYGIFISHKSEDWALAGRIYDYFKASGYNPFLDTASLRQGPFNEELEKQIKQTPYFLLVLTPRSFKNLSAKSWVLKEIRMALKSERNFLMIATKDFKWPKILPKDINHIKNLHCYTLERENFLDIMNKLCFTDLKKNHLQDILDWKTQAKFLSQSFISSREYLEKNIATLENRFGGELIECIKNNREYTGENHIKSIHMSCYAASLIFAPSINMVDERAFDRGLIFNIFAQLLKDDDFSLEIIINAPGCDAAIEAAVHKKLGNNRLEDFPEAIFLSSYCNIQKLIEHDPVFHKAYYEDRRFKFMVTDVALPYSIFQITYKTGFEQNNHIKLDLYSEGLTSNMDRRSTLFFKDNDPDNYNFFIRRYEYIRNQEKSNKLIKENHENWITEWETLKGKINYAE